MPVWKDRTYWRYQFQLKGKRYSKTGFVTEDEAAEEMAIHRCALTLETASKEIYLSQHRVRAAFQRWAEKKGIKPPKECSGCGQEKKIESHHPDYSKPFEVKWFCRKCHQEEHKRLKKIKPTQAIDVSRCDGTTY